jgi:hypothetical protein
MPIQREERHVRSTDGDASAPVEKEKEKEREREIVGLQLSFIASEIAVASGTKIAASNGTEIAASNGTEIAASNGTEKIAVSNVGASTSFGGGTRRRVTAGGRGSTHTS